MGRGLIGRGGDLLPQVLAVTSALADDVTAAGAGSLFSQRPPPCD